MAADERENGLIMLARFENPAALLRAARRLHEAGYKKYDCHSPFPIHGLNKAMGLSRSKLGYLVGLFALVGFSGAVLLQWWTHAVDYPTIISGKPYFAYPAYLPVTFALAVLLSAFAAVVGMLIINGLPRFNHPLFDSEQFRGATDNAFFVSVESADPQFDIEKTKLLLESVGGKNIEILPETGRKHGR